MRDTTEACDGTDIGGLDCVDLGFDAGELTCRSDCDVDLASCCDDACPADGDTQCDGDTVQTCGMTASGCLAWDDTTDCGANDPVGVCDATATGFGCVDDCQDGCLLEGAQQCDASAIETCQFGADGCLDWLPTFDCGANVPAQTCQAAADIASATELDGTSAASVATEGKLIDKYLDIIDIHLDDGDSSEAREFIDALEDAPLSAPQLAAAQQELTKIEQRLGKTNKVIINAF